MKIAVVSGHASPNVYVSELSAAMAHGGHEVTVFTRRDDPGLPERVVTSQGYTVVHVRAGPPEPLPEHGLLSHIDAFIEYLDDEWAAEPPDVAHAHFWTSGIATQLATRAHRIPSVQTFHTLGVVERRHRGEQDTSPNARINLEKLVAQQANWVAATCTDEVFELVRLGRNRARISVVPCGVDLAKFSTEGTVAARSERPRIVAAGRTLPRKGFDTMIEALPAIPDAEFVIVGGPVPDEVGDDPEVRRLLAVAAEAGVADRVAFTGALAHAEMPAMLRSADVVTCTPWYEPFGTVALEAMACGVPVVASAVGGLLDAVVHDVTGRLVAPRRPRECAEAVTTILRDSFLRRSLGLAGRDRACARYAWDRVAADTVRLYDRLASASGEVRTSRSG